MARDQPGDPPARHDDDGSVRVERGCSVVDVVRRPDRRAESSLRSLYVQRLPLRVERREPSLQLHPSYVASRRESVREDRDQLPVDLRDPLPPKDQLVVAHDRTASHAAKERHLQTHSTVRNPAARSSSSFHRAVTGTSTPSSDAAFRSISSRVYPFRSFMSW